VKLISNDSGSSAQLLRDLDKAETVLAPELLEGLSVRYVKRTGILEINDRGSTLELFARAAAQPDGKERTARARAVIEAVLPTQRDAGRKAMLEAVLVVLGDRSHLGGASLGLESPVSTSDFPSLDEDVVAWALRRAGCAPEQLEAAAKARKKLTACAAK
jgi:hypothetical protein